MEAFDGPGIDLFGKSAMAGQRDDPVPGLKIGDAGTDREHIAGAFGAGGKRKIRLELIFTLGDQNIGKRVCRTIKNTWDGIWGKFESEGWEQWVTL